MKIYLKLFPFDRSHDRHIMLLIIMGLVRDKKRLGGLGFERRFRLVCNFFWRGGLCGYKGLAYGKNIHLTDSVGEG